MIFEIQYYVQSKNFYINGISRKRFRNVLVILIIKNICHKIFLLKQQIKIELSGNAQKLIPRKRNGIHANHVLL